MKNKNQVKVKINIMKIILLLFIIITITKDKFYYILNKENHLLEDSNYNKKILEKLPKALTTDENNISL